MCVSEMLLLGFVTGIGGGVAALLEPSLRNGRLLMVLGACFAAAVAMLFVAGLGQLPQLFPIRTLNGPFRLGWALLGSLGSAATIVVAIRRHLRDDELTTRHSVVP